MAIQTLMGKKGLGELLGTGLGSGISQGLQQLAQQKMSQLAQRQRIDRSSQGLQSLGIPQQEASQIAMLPEGLQSEVVKNYLRGAEEAGLAEALGALGMGPGGKSPSPQLPQQEGEMAQEQPGFKDVLRQPRLSQKAKMDIAKLQQKERFAESKERREAFKETKAERKDIIDKAKADKENLFRIERMEKLNDSDRLTNPALYSVLKKFGLDFPVLLTPESQEFKKLTIDFLKDAKKIFGARVTNFEAEKFLESIPSLSQTKEGRKRVIRNLKLFYKGSEFKSKAMREVIRDNGGVPPLDLLEQVDERVEPLMDNLAIEFKQGIEGEAPKVDSNSLGSRFKALPKVSTLPVGTEITNKKTGAVYRSDGTSWKRI